MKYLKLYEDIYTYQEIGMDEFQAMIDTEVESLSDSNVNKITKIVKKFDFIYTVKEDFLSTLTFTLEGDAPDEYSIKYRFIKLLSAKKSISIFKTKGEWYYVWLSGWSGSTYYKCDQTDILAKLIKDLI